MASEAAVAEVDASAPGFTPVAGRPAGATGATTRVPVVRGPQVQPVRLLFSSLRLVSKTTLVEGVPGQVCPVRTFTFELGPGVGLGYNLGRGDHVKMVIPGL
jgi:hypothetical protein